MAITAAKALELLTKYGADVVFRVYEASSYDPATGKRTMGTAAQHTVKAVEEHRKDQVPGWADMVLYVSPSGMEFVPAVLMEVVYAGKTWVVVMVKPTTFKGQTVLYELAVKAVA
ncbi:MAG TPA: hypothetical protein PLL20_20955 [Phycisphaerae bacterium]|nr:hypothetical protein [Phycisphaerae bacterium]HRS13340.1 hypothetical protein [Sedimentisphaerales bacterium]